MAAAKEKSKFSHLVGPEIEDDGEEGAEGDGGPLGDEEEKTPTEGYDFKSCAHDMMAAFQSGDTEALTEALEEFADKVGSK